MWNILRKHVESTSQKSSTLKPNTTSTSRTSSIIAKTSSIDYEDNDDDDDNDDNDDIDPDIHTNNMRSLDVHTILSGCKGWPSDASCVVYHRLEGLICVGTFGGAIFVYGDGFQLVRPWLTDNPIEVSFMVVVYPNKLFVTFSDNSAQLLELPSLTLVALLGSNWITNRNENITTVYVDEAGQLPFAFVGTSEGVVSVLDLSGPFSIRVCDYVISWKTFGLKSAYQVTDIQIYPKDEKYLAISYDSISSSAGHVVIYDLTKQKPYRSYDTTNAIVSLAWQHQGDMLFAATKSGKVLSLGVEKTQESSASLWRAAQELVDGDSTDEEEEQVCIKKVTWVAPQPPSTEGCLFVLLGSKGVDDDDDLKNVIVGLSPNNGNLNDLQLVFALPPLSFEKVLSFDVMPSCEKGEASSNPDDGDGDNTDNNYVPVITPALLLFTSKSNDNDDDGDNDDEEKKPLRQLKLVRCPVTDMSQWALEVGTLMDPRPAVEVSSSTSRITFMTGFVPEHSALSLSTALMAKATQHEGSIVQQSTTTTTTTTIYDSDEDNAKDNGKNTKVSQQQVKGKRLSARDFLSIHIQELEEQLNQQTNSWEVVLATGVHQDNLHDASTSRLQDIVINGHENGSIIIWGTSLTKRDPSNSAGKGSIWRPLTSLSCGRVGISHISHDETAGLLLAADESGVVVIWSIMGEDGSSLSVLQKCKVEAMNEGKVFACEHFQDKYTDNKKFPVDHDDQESTDYDLHKFIDHKSEDAVETMMKYPLHSSKKFDNLQEIVRIKLNRRVTATLLLSSFLQVFIGTEDGKLFTCPNLSSNEFKEIVHAHRPTHFATAGSIISLQFGNFYHTEQILVPAVFVVYRSGLVTVIQLNTLQLIGYSTSHTKMKEEHLSYLRDCEEESCHRDHHYDHHRTVDICIANSFYEKLLPPDLLTVNIFLAEDQLTGGSILSTTSPTKQGVGSDTKKDRGTHSHSSFLANAFKTTSSSLDRSKGDLYGSSDDVPFIRRRMNPKIIPRYLMIVRGKYLFTYDLHKFKRASSHKCLAGYSGKCLSATTVSQKSIVAYKFLSYFKHEKDDDDGNDDSDDGHSHESILCVSYVNSDGIHGLFATKEKAPLGHHNFLDTILEDHSHLSFGAVLPNGNCYLNDSDRIIYNITTSILNSTYKLNHPLPDRASPDSAAPSRTMMLLSGRESILASKNSLRSKRRSSVIGRISAAAPTDLSLIFRKSMDQRQKDELIGVKGSPSTMEGSDDEGDTFNSNPSSSSSGGNRNNWKSSSTTATTKALSTMNETGLALQERGDRINRLAHQSDDLREGASQFRDNAKKQKEILKKRSSLFSWG